MRRSLPPGRRSARVRFSVASGSGQKLAQLGRAYRWVELDIMAGSTQLDLGPYPAVRAWLARVASQPGYVPLTVRPS